MEGRKLKTISFLHGAGYCVIEGPPGKGTLTLEVYEIDTAMSKRGEKPQPCRTINLNA